MRNDEPEKRIIFRNEFRYSLVRLRGSCIKVSALQSVKATVILSVLALVVVIGYLIIKRPLVIQFDFGPALVSFFSVWGFLFALGILAELMPKTLAFSENDVVVESVNCAESFRSDAVECVVFNEARGLTEISLRVLDHDSPATYRVVTGERAANAKNTLKGWGYQVVDGGR